MTSGVVLLMYMSQKTCVLANQRHDPACLEHLIRTTNDGRPCNLTTTTSELLKPLIIYIFTKHSRSPHSIPKAVVMRLDPQGRNP